MTRLRTLDEEGGYWWNRPCAAVGFMSYRYRGPYGWIMIGALDDAEALREAARSFIGPGPVDRSRLERWDGARYVPVGAA